MNPYLVQSIYKNLLQEHGSSDLSCTLAKKGLTLSQTSPGFLHVCSKFFKNTVGKGEITHNYFSHSIPYPFEELSAIFFKFEIVVCKLFQLRRV